MFRLSRIAFTKIQFFSFSFLQSLRATFHVQIQRGRRKNGTTSRSSSSRLPSFRSSSWSSSPSTTLLTPSVAKPLGVSSYIRYHLFLCFYPSHFSQCIIQYISQMLFAFAFVLAGPFPQRTTWCADSTTFAGLDKPACGSQGNISEVFRNLYLYLYLYLSYLIAFFFVVFGLSASIWWAISSSIMYTQLETRKVAFCLFVFLLIIFRYWAEYAQRSYEFFAYQPSTKFKTLILFLLTINCSYSCYSIVYLENANFSIG